MRVLLANHTPIVGSGSGTYVLTIASGLVSRGHEVAVLTPPGGSQPGVREIRCFVADELGERFPSFTGHPLSPVLYGQLSPEELARVTSVWERSIGSIQRRWRPAVIHTQHLWVVTCGALGVAENVITTCHGSEVACLEAESPDARRFHRGRSPLVVISVSRYVQGLADPHIPEETVRVALLNPYDPALFAYHPKLPSSDRMHIGFVGRLVAYKHGEQFLELVQRLADRVPDLTASFVGDGPDRDRLEGISRSRRLTGHVRFLGFQELSRMPSIYAALDAVIFCSPSEPFGLAALEAAACGTPVFVPDSGGLAEMAQSPYIRQYSWQRLDHAVDDIAHLLAVPESEALRIARSRYVRQRYSLDAYLDELELIYHRTIGDRQMAREL